MAATYKLIETVTVGSGGAANIEFTSIPQTYTDLILLYSGRSTRAAAGDDMYIRFNGLSTNLSSRVLYGTGSTTASFSDASVAYVGYFDGDTSTASVFSNGSIYIANYTAAVAKSISGDVVNENNGTAAIQQFNAGLWNATVAINQINLYALNGNWKQYSSVSLYGIKNS
jgi:hypothetical protein